MTHHWLLKSEPSTYGIDHLQKDGKTAWTGVRNFQARNYMQQMQIGDPILYYHSSCPVPGVYGLAAVASEPYPDPTQFDETSHYYEPRATKEKPVWYLVDVKFVKKFKEPIPLSAMRQNSELAGMLIMAPRCRLSVTPVTAKEFAILAETATLTKEESPT